MLTYTERQEMDGLTMVNIKPKILVVDDNPKNLQYATKILIEAGYDVSVAQNGTNAINYILKSNPPDLILLDVMMPGISGYEVCEKLKSFDSLRDIPIIFLTAKSETEDIVKGFELGGVDYISKPFKPKEILVRIKTQIDLVRTKRQLEYKNRLLDNFNKNLVEQVQKRTEELSLTKNDLEKFKGIKSEFLAQISHEIRTPINVIINYHRFSL
ncbi:MAG: response regulator [bacterium]